MKKLTKIISLVLSLALAAVVFASCGKTDIKEPDGPITGGWQFDGTASSDITAKQKAVFDKAVDGLVGASHEPKTVLATQVVAGTNYAFLCVSTPVVPNAESHWSIAVVYEDLGGNVELVGFEDIDGANVKTKANATSDGAVGAWTVDVKESGVKISDAVDGAISLNAGVSLVPAAVLATQLVAGTNYRVLAYGTTATATPTSDLYVVDVYASLDGKAEITSISVFDLAAYINPLFTE